MRVCNRCSQEKPENKKHFRISRKSIGGLGTVCRTCSRLENSRYMKRRGDVYRAWNQAKKRCYNSNDSAYEFYGERGIKMSDDWLYSYKNFVRDMGSRPTIKHSLDRINNDGNYEKGNCRWASKEQQMQNRRKLKSNTSGVTGVSFHKNNNAWVSSITYNGKRLFLGYYKDFNEAVRVRRSAEVKYHKK